MTQPSILNTKTRAERAKLALLCAASAIAMPSAAYAQEAGKDAGEEAERELVQTMARDGELAGWTLTGLTTSDTQPSTDQGEAQDETQRTAESAATKTAPGLDKALQPMPGDVTVSYRTGPSKSGFVTVHRRANDQDTVVKMPVENGVARAETHSSAVGAPATAAHEGDADEVDDLLALSFEELLAQEVTSAAKKSRRVGDSTAAITVITQDDIRRSAARTVPDLLRMVPGMEIAEVQSSATSVSSRGFTSRFAANMLVMVDGASIYSTSISGMFWDQALIPLQDIDRIEVIRGPGGTLWGSNAMNGIVNIITKQSVDTQGVRVNASIGTFDMRTELGFGKQLNDSLGFRLYGDYRRTRGLDGINGNEDGDSWAGGLAGVRVDYAPIPDGSLVVVGEYSDGNFSERVIEVSLTPFQPIPQTRIQDNIFGSTHILGRWQHQTSDDFDYTVQAYFNELRRTEFEAKIDRHLYHISAEGRWHADAMHEFNFGFSGRVVKDIVTNSPALTLPGGTNVDRRLSGYIQDDISIIPDKLRITIGSKFETNNYSGFEVQPSARIFYRTSPQFAIWGAVSRAVRTPLLIQREMIASITALQDVPGFAEPVLVTGRYMGNPDAESERVTTFELGWRGDIGRNWSFDAATYYAHYTRLATARIASQTPVFAPGIPFPVGIEVHNTVGNEGAGKAFGGEIMLSGRVMPWWHAEASYSYLNLENDLPLGTSSLASDRNSPFHQFRLRSEMDFNDHLSLNAFLHHVSVAKNGERPAYTDLSMKLTYRPNTQIEFSLAGRNLLTDRHLEYVNTELPINDVYVPRSAYVEARVRF